MSALTHGEATTTVFAAKLDALDDGKPQLAEIIEFVDDLGHQLESSARAHAIIGWGKPNAEAARKMVVCDSLLRLLDLIKANEADFIERAKQWRKGAAQ